MYSNNINTYTNNLNLPYIKVLYNKNVLIAFGAKSSIFVAIHLCRILNINKHSYRNVEIFKSYLKNIDFNSIVA